MSRLASVLLIACAVVWAQGSGTKSVKPATWEEILLGTWRLVPDLSKFQPEPAPRAEIRAYKRTADGVVVTIKTTDRSGAVQTVSYPWRPDASAARVTGSKSYDTIRLTQIDNLTFEASLSQGTKVVATERRGVAKDGQTMTIIVTDLTSGKPTTTVRAVFEKQ